MTMTSIIEQFLNLKYEGQRFTGGRLPLDVLSDLQALEDILTTFAREIWLRENARERMPTGYTDWFRMSLTGVGDGSAIPKIEIAILEDRQQVLLESETRQALITRAEREFAKVLEAASQGRDVTLSATQIRNFNRFLTNLKPGEQFKYSASRSPISPDNPDVISLDLERRKRFLTSVRTSYEQRIQGHARLKSVDENGSLRFVNSEYKEFPVADSSRAPTEYGSKIGSYYEFDLTVEFRHDDSIQSVITIHDLSPLEHPAISAIDEMADLESGWLDGHGREVSVRTINSAKNFLRICNPLPQFYAVAPTEHGGILLEYYANGWDYGIEFNDDGTIAFFAVEINGRSEISEEYSSDRVDGIAERVKRSLR